MRRIGLLPLAAVLICGMARPSLAYLPYVRIFDQVYLAEHENADFVKSVRDRKNRCFVCHQGKNRKNCNLYGVQLAEVLATEKIVRDVEKIKEALAKVGEMHSDPKDDKSPTYDDLIKDGKFPGGSLDEVQKEPEPPT